MTRARRPSREAFAASSTSSRRPGRRDQLVHRFEIVDEQLAVEMVQLVLEARARNPVPDTLTFLPCRFWATTQTFSRRVT